MRALRWFVVTVVAFVVLAAPVVVPAWDVTVKPDGHGSVTVSLPATTGCGASAAICTPDRRPLSSSVSVTVAGPVGISVADAGSRKPLIGFDIEARRRADGSGDGWACSPRPASLLRGATSLSEV